MTERTFVGTEVLRVDARDKVDGQAKFVADIHAGRMVHARIVRSEYAHARLKSVDVSKALAMPGVKAIVTGDNVPGRIGHAIQDQYPIARDKVRYWGEPVAVVIAQTAEQAELARLAVRVEYDALPAVLHPRDAILTGAPLIHEELGSYVHDPLIHPEPGTNKAHHYHLQRGDLDEVFRTAHLVVENEYWMPWIAHAQLEPHGAIALWDGDAFTIWSSSQSPFFIRETISHLFDLSPALVRIQIPYVGGGFGGKSDVTIEPLLAICARAVPGVPVRLLLTREEMFYGTVVGRGAWGRLKTAVDSQGVLLGQEAELYFGSGGNADYSIWISQGGGHNSTGPYQIPNLRIDSYAVYTNTPPTGAFRGYGHPEVHWMMERQVNQIARRLGMDPVDIRIRNLLMPGKVNALGQIMKEYNGKADACLMKVKELLGPLKPSSPGHARGQGIACFMKSPVMRTNAQSGAIIRFNEDGSATIYTGAVELGQGVNTIMTQIAAEALCMPIEKVFYSARIDTDFSPHEWQTVASHTTWAVGNAIRLAAGDALDQLKNAASEVLGVKKDDLVTENGLIYPSGHPETAISYERFATGYRRENGAAVNPPIVGRGTFVPKGLTFPDPISGQGNIAASWTFGCQGADLEIDLNTGRIQVLRLISVQDAGRVINPLTAKGQVEGAMTQALGATLMEKIQLDSRGKIVNPSFTDYRILTSVDAPVMDVHFIQTDDATGPYGARGLGEHGVVAVAPAIANAIAEAIGFECTTLPIEPVSIMDFIESGGKND